MTDKPNDKLDGLLRRWAKSRSPTEQRIATLRERIFSAVRDVRLMDAEPPLPSRRLPIAGRAMWCGLGAAAAMLVACLLWPGETARQQVLMPKTFPEARGLENQDTDMPAFALLRRSYLTGKATLLDEMEHVFAGQLRWVAECDGKVCVGLAPRPGSTSPRAPVAVRVVVASRQDADSDWTPVWAVNVVTRGEEIVELAPDDSGNGQVVLWMYLLPDGMIAIDANIALDGPIPIHYSGSRIQRTGVPRAVLSVQADDIEYRVFQTVAVITDKLG